MSDTDTTTTTEDAPAGITVERAAPEPDAEPTAPAPEATEADKAAQARLQAQELEREAEERAAREDTERRLEEERQAEADELATAAERAAVPTVTVDERPHAQLPTGDTHVHLSTQPKTHETWVNVTRGRVVLIFGDGRGGKRHDIINPKRPFQITPAERLMNEHTAASEKQDPFLNGTLQPVDLIDGLPEHEQARFSPNHVGKVEMEDLFEASPAKFAARLSSIENETALKALLEMAVQPDVDARHSQIEAIRARLAEVAERPIEHVKSGVAEAGAAGGPASGIGRAVTPK